MILVAGAKSAPQNSVEPDSVVFWPMAGMLTCVRREYDHNKQNGEMIMKSEQSVIPSYAQLIEATFQALKELGGSGKNNEINEKVAEIMNLPEEILSVPHLDRDTLSEVNYRLAWARTLLKNHGALENSAKGVWAITSEFSGKNSVDGGYIEKNCKRASASPSQVSNADITEGQMENAGVEIPEEVKPWREKLHNVLLKMNPYSFEKLTQRLLRECGFYDVSVTKKSGDGGIDGVGKFKINGIFSFNLAFQCKRYQGPVGAPDIRDFRGSLTTDIEKGVFITTGVFSKQAIEEAATPGKKQIDLINGEDFISKLAELGIGVKEVKDYEIDENYFLNM